jgi:hypothetical protein
MTSMGCPPLLLAFKSLIGIVRLTSLTTSIILGKPLGLYGTELAPSKCSRCLYCGTMERMMLLTWNCVQLACDSSS